MHVHGRGFTDTIVQEETSTFARVPILSQLVVERRAKKLKDRGGSPSTPNALELWT